MRGFRGVRAVGVAVIAALALPFSAVDAASSAELDSPVILRVADRDGEALTRALSKLGVNPSATYSETIVGAAAELTPTEVMRLRREIPSLMVEDDLTLTLSDVQTPTPSWGIDELDQTSTTPDNSYSFPSSAGDGVDAYVIDTGLRTGTYETAGSELYGRVATGMNFGTGRDGVTVDPAYTDDCLTSFQTQKEGGHGTHVAGTIGSSSFGVAKRVTIVPVRVFGCATLNNGRLEANAQASTVISALDWAVARRQSTGRPGVANLSLGGSCTNANCAGDSLMAAVARATGAGLSVVVAAGNSGVDACQVSPAAAPSAITVGAVDANRQISSWSNYGSCISVLAPGVNITSVNAWYYTSPRQDNIPSVTMDGTSMASPHVAGVAALYLSGAPSASPAQVKNALTTAATSGTVTGLTSSRATTPNRFANASFLLAAEPSISSPFGLLATNTKATSVNLAWQAPSVVTNASISDYSIEMRPTLSTTWTTVTDGVSTSTSAAVGGLSPGSSYLFRVSAVSSTQNLTSLPSATLTVLSGTGKTTAVRSLKLAARGMTTLNLSWLAPSNLRGGVISDYVVTYRRVGTSKLYTFKDGVSTRRTAKLTGLRRWTSYQVRIYPKTAQGLGSVSTITVRTR